VTIVVDILVAQIGPDPPVNDQSLPNSSRIVIHLLAAKPLWLCGTELYPWKSPSATQQQHSWYALTETGRKLSAALWESLILD